MVNGFTRTIIVNVETFYMVNILLLNRGAQDL